MVHADGLPPPLLFLCSLLSSLLLEIAWKLNESIWLFDASMTIIPSLRIKWDRWSEQIYVSYCSRAPAAWGWGERELRATGCYQNVLWSAASWSQREERGRWLGVIISHHNNNIPHLILLQFLNWLRSTSLNSVCGDYFKILLCVFSSLKSVSSHRTHAHARDFVPAYTYN
jgi:hypothetical protein